LGFSVWHYSLLSRWPTIGPVTGYSSSVVEPLSDVAMYCAHRPSHLITSSSTTHLVRDLVGLDEDRLGFRNDVVAEVLEVPGERTVVQVEVREAVGHSNISLPQASAPCS
jgi:hypothetical protein